jgi:hypothetical protein
MKNMIFRIAFIVIAIVAFSSSSKALVTFRFNVVIDYDNCSPSGYQGNYVVNCVVKNSLGSTICSGQKANINYKLIGQQVEVSFSCDIPDQEANCNYELDITICRQTSPLTCCTTLPQTGVCWPCLDGSLGLCDFHVHL